MGFCVAQPAKVHATAMLSAGKMNVFMLSPPPSTSRPALWRIADAAIPGRALYRNFFPQYPRAAPHGGSSAVDQAGRTSGRFLGNWAMTERSRLRVSATISIGLRASQSDNNTCSKRFARNTSM